VRLFTTGSRDMNHCVYVCAFVCVRVCVCVVCMCACLCVCKWVGRYLALAATPSCSAVHVCVCVCVCLCVCHKIHVHAFYLLMNSINGGSCSLLDFYMLAQGVLATSSVCHIIYYIGIM
jgi:hypothetical protein